jgi:hypothetical protein
VAGAVNQTVKKAFNSRYDIIGSAAVSFSNTSSNTNFNTATGIVNPDAVTIATVTLPQPYTVTLNGNGGSNGPVYSATVDAYGNFTPSVGTFLAPAGKTLAGWATSPNGTPAASVKITGDTTLYAIWESYNYPTYTAPAAGDAKNTVSMIQLWGVGNTNSPIATFANWIALPENHTEVVVLNHAIMTEQQAADYNNRLMLENGVLDADLNDPSQLSDTPVLIGIEIVDEDVCARLGIEAKWKSGKTSLVFGQCSNSKNDDQAVQVITDLINAAFAD